ncbi:MAG: CBS domain-containing protein [Deltaproteobacteria bacterium]|nr:CBS domain-containing protein [Deltaproteobacteria bacterium]MCW5803906.1 CBS domain-containing protein [Deltaproteobacteria bacterium]
MKVRDVMTKFPAVCTPDMPIESAARLMVNADCGAIPVVGEVAELPIGMITDRDIVVRAVALGRGPEILVREIMSSPAVTVTDDMGLRDCIDLLESRQIRRAIVVDATGRCVGIIATADIAQHASRRKSGELLEKVSRPSITSTTSRSPGAAARSH